MSWELLSYIMLFGVTLFNTGVTLYLWTEMKALQKSTHQIQYVNLGDQEFQKLSEDMKDKLEEDPFGNIQ